MMLIMVIFIVMIALMRAIIILLIIISTMIMMIKIMILMIIIVSRRGYAIFRTPHDLPRAQRAAVVLSSERVQGAGVGCVCTCVCAQRLGGAAVGHRGHGTSHHGRTGWHEWLAGRMDRTARRVMRYYVCLGGMCLVGPGRWQNE